MSIINWLFGNRKKESSGDKAVSRMKMMLVHDRVQVPPEMVQEMKEELLKVMEKYFPIDAPGAECAIKTKEGRTTFIITNVPVLANSTSLKGKSEKEHLKESVGA